MGAIKTAFEEAYRDHNTAGIAASQLREPQKAELRALGAVIEQVFGVMSAGIGEVEEEADLPVDGPDVDDPRVVMVLNDPIPANNGVKVWRNDDWEVFTEYYNAVALVVQPLVDQATTEADRARDEADALADLTVTVPGANLFDAATMIVYGEYIANNNTIAANILWARGVVSVAGIENITWVSPEEPRRLGATFLSAPTVPMPGQQILDDPGTGGIISRPVPVGAAFLSFNMRSDQIALPAKTMVNIGSVALPFEEYEAPSRFVPASKVYNDVNEEGLPLILSASSVPGSSSYEVPLGDGIFTQRFSPLLPKSHLVGSLWNFHSYLLDGVLQSVDATDDIAPYRVGGGTVGANHGYPSTRLTKTAHGKTLADVGSVYAEGGVEWVIVDVPSVNQVRVTKRTGNGFYTGTTLTHVSGGTNTAALTPTAKLDGDFRPVHKNRRTSAQVGGVEAEFGKSYRPDRGFSFGESYDVINKDSLVDWLIGEAGTPTNIADYEGTADFTVSHSRHFDTYGGVTTATDFVALQNVAAFQDIMFAQMYRMAATGGVLKYLIPDTAPLTFESNNYDFSKPVDMTGWAPAGRLNISPGTVDCAAAAHGKAAADINSVYTDGVNQWRIYAVPDANTLTIKPVTGNPAYADAPLVHVSGGVNHAAVAPTSSAVATVSRIADHSIWPDRVIQFNGSMGYAIGFLPIRAADPATRPLLSNRKAAQISEIGKIYMSAIDNTGRTSLTAGDRFSGVHYRTPVALSADRTCSYVVRDVDADWLYVDWHASIHDRLPLPADLQRRAYTLHRKTAGVTIRSEYATDSLLFDVVTGGGAGQYAILRFDR